jgi:hypothetical protein
MNELPKHIQETYEEEFHRPEGSIRLLTQHEWAFLRALYRLNYFNKEGQEYVHGRINSIN